MPVTESVTILFTDLVGSTELSYSLAPDAADEVRRAHFSTLRDAIVESGGTEVKNLGDGIMVAFSASSTALTCAVAMQQAVELQNRSDQHELGLRVGISGGEVTREAEDFFGDPVIEAARLCAKAEGGQILASQFVQLMAGRRCPHVFRLVGELELKGLFEPVDTVEVAWEPLVGSGAEEIIELETPLPPTLATLPDIGRVLGRDEPLEALIQAYKRVEAGEGREVVLVSGEPGVGKSTLVASVARRVKELGACVLYGHYDEGVTLSYRGFAEALGHYVNSASDELLRSHVDADGPELAVIVPAIGRRLGDLPENHDGDPDTMRFMLFASVVGWLAKATVHAPVVIVLEDLHWADTQSLQLLRHLVGSSDPLRLLVIATYRDEIGPSHPLTQTLASMRREPRIDQMSLTGLDEVGVLDFLETALARRLDDDGAEFAYALRQETEGNPFFVAELLRHLLETNAICDGEGRLDIRGSLSQMSLPQSVRQVISARVDRLGTTAVRVLSLASVIGRDFEFEVLASAAEVPEEELLDLFDEAEASALVAELDNEPGRYRFAHALIAHTLADELGPTRRSRAHRKVALAYEALLAQDLGVEQIEDHHISRLQVSNSRRRGNRLRRLAHHYTLTADPRDRPRALAYCQKAGEAALQALAPDEASEWFRRAVEMHEEVDHGDPLRGVDLNIGLGTAQRHAGEAANRQTLLGAALRAEELGEAERLTRAILTACDGGLSAALGYLDEEKVARLEGALTLAGDADSPTRAILLARLCSEITFGAPLERRTELADQARSMARRLGDPAILLEVLNTIQYTLDVPETLEDRVEETAQALELSEQVGNPALSFWAAWLRSVATMQAGLPAELEQSMQVMERLKDLRGYPVDREMTLIRRSTLKMLHGDAEDAERDAAAALEIGIARGLVDAWSTYGAQVIVVRWEQGRLYELVDLVAHTAEENPGVPAFRAALALAHCESGHVDEAGLLLDDMAVDRFGSVTRDTGWLVALHAYAEVAIQLRHREAAAQLSQLLEPSHWQVGANPLVVSGTSAHYLGGLAGVLGRAEEADRLFAEATAINERMGMRFFGARTALEWGKLLASRGRPGDLDRARRLLEEAHATAETNGYEVVAARAASAKALLEGPDRQGGLLHGADSAGTH